MNELRYFLRGIVRSLRRYLRSSHGRRETITALLSFLIGVLGYFLTKRWAPPPVRDAISTLITAMLALLGVWWGVQFGRRAWKIYQQRREQRVLYSDGLYLSYEAKLEPLSQELRDLTLRALHEAEQFLQTPLELTPRFVEILTEESQRTLHANRSISGRANTTWGVVYAVYHGDMEDIYRTLLHEWTHLITLSWCEDAPSFFMEGIAIAAEYHDDSLPAHTNALYYLYYYPNRSILSLFSDQEFHQKEWQYAHYAWAGSFTLYWIERYGLPRFRKFYRRLADQSIDEAFHAEYGLSLGQAELQWREYLHKELPETSRFNTLKRALGNSLRWAIYELSYLTILTLAERTRCEYPDYWMGYYGLGVCAFWRGDLESALQWFEQANTAPMQDETDFRGRAWCECGFVCDLLGKREQAVQCYQRALEYPDYEDSVHAYHARARQHLATPYTYAERYKFLKGE